MNKSTDASAQTLVLEVTRRSSGKVSLVLSIPGREGTSERVWSPPVPWDDVQAATLAALSDFLWLTGGVQQQLVPGAPD